MTSLEQQFQKAVAKLRGGQLKSAEKILLQIDKRQSGIPDVLHMLGFIAMESDRPAVAVKHLSQAVEKVPGNLELIGLLGAAHYRVKEFDQAIDCFLKVLSAQPELVDTRFNLANALLDANRIDEAEAEFSRLVAQTPDDAACHAGLGTALLGLGKHDAACDAFSAALSRDPENAKIFRLLADAQDLKGSNEDALSSLDRALALQPDNPDTLMAKADLLERTNRVAEASDAVTRGLRIEPRHAGLQLIAARLDARSGDHEKALKTLEAIDDGTQTLELQRDRSYELGKVYDRLGRYDQAYRSFAKGNEIAGRMWHAPQSGKDVMIAHVDRHKNAVTEDWMATWIRPGANIVPGQSPIFIVGFPRSGTTLMGQILDCHPDLQVMDEPPTIDCVRTSLLAGTNDYPEILATLPDAETERLRQMYFETVREQLDLREDAVLVDKMPLNLVEVPLILRLFPDARFILCLRHPCDACLSCFMQHFEMNAGMANFLTLENTARLYESVISLWQRYRELFGLVVLDIRYEDLVEDMEANTRAMLDFIGVPWNDAVLEYRQRAAHSNVRTPSYAQVTQEIYTSARYRWMRYRDHLEPVLAQLQPFIETYGYADKDQAPG